MRLLLLLVLWLGLAMALPQESRRGSRRFSIATPGLPAGLRRRRPTNVVSETEAEAPELVEEPEEVKQAPQRRRLSPRLRSRPSSITQPTEEPIVEETEKTMPSEDLSPAPKRPRTRLRRPIKKVLTTTTTTTTTTLPPEIETMPPKPQDMVDEEAKDSILPITEPEKDMTKAEPEMQAVKEQPAEESVAPEDPVRPVPKLRPIPIKLGRRNQKKPIENNVAETQSPKEEEPTVPDSSNPSTHRFSSRPRGPRIRGRARGSRRNQEVAQNEQIPVEETPSPPSEEPPQRTRTRGRGLSRPFPGARRRTRPVQEETPSTAATDDTPAEEPKPEEPTSRRGTSSRFPNLKSLKKILSNRKTTVRRRRPLVSPRLRRPPIIKSAEKPQLDSTPKAISVLEISSKSSVLDTNVQTNFGNNKEKDPAEVIIQEEERVPVSVTADTKPPTISTTPSTTISSSSGTSAPPRVSLFDIRASESTESPKRFPLLVPTSVPTFPPFPTYVQEPEATTTTTITRPPRIRSRPRPKTRTPSDRENDIVVGGGDRSFPLIGTVEDTPPEELRSILSGFGSRRRGLSRSKPRNTGFRNTPVEVSPPSTSLLQEKHMDDADYLYDYYDYLLEGEALS